MQYNQTAPIQQTAPQVHHAMTSRLRSHRRVADPRLRARQHKVAARRRLCAGEHPARVGSSVGLREAECADRLARGCSVANVNRTRWYSRACSVVRAEAPIGSCACAHGVPWGGCVVGTGRPDGGAEGCVCAMASVCVNAIACARVCVRVIVCVCVREEWERGRALPRSGRYFCFCSSVPKVAIGRMTCTRAQFRRECVRACKRAHAHRERWE